MPDGASAQPPSESVGRRVFRQTTAYAALRVITGVLTWGAFVVLGRLLDRRSFGAFEIGMFYLGAGQLLGDGGFAASLVRRPGAVADTEYRTAFTFVFAVSVSLGTVLFALAPWIGRINALTTDEIWALRALTPLYVLPALRLIPYVKLERAVDFAALGRIELYANAARHTSAIAIAALHGGVWALAVSQIVLSSVQIALAYRRAPGWLGFGWSTTIFRSLLAYGSPVQASVLLIHLKTNLAAGLLGPTLGPAAVGTFRFALELVRAPADVIGSLARVQFPIYAASDRTRDELHRLLRGTLRGAWLLGLLILGMLAFGAEWFVPAVYGEKWRSALPVVLSLAPHVAADLVAPHLFTFLQGRGRAGLALATYATWSGALYGLSAATLLFDGGLELIALSHGLVSWVVVAALLRWSGQHLGRPLLRGVGAPLVAATSAFVLALTVRELAGGSAVSRAILASIAFVVCYVGAVSALDGRAVLNELRAARLALRR